MNYCYLNPEPQPKSVSLKFQRAELLYDVENYSFVEGDIATGENAHIIHQLQDIAQSGNVDRVTRVLNLAYSECVEMLYPYTEREIPTEEVQLDNILIAPNEYTINLTLPKGFSLTTINLLKELIHEYLVCKVVADWMSITYPSSKDKWEEKILTARGKITTCINSRRGKIRRPLKPF